MDEQGTTILGLDGARLGGRAGWALARLEARSGRPALASIEFLTSFAAVLERYPRAVSIGVDIPIGLVAEGRRSADQAAREALPGRASTVFPTAPRAALEDVDFPTALARSRRLSGRGLSKQAWHLGPRIRELDAFAGDARIVEVHPELSFRVLAGAPLLLRKQTAGGQAVRRSLLRSVGLDVDAHLARLAPDAEASRLGTDDLLDAVVAAWSAWRSSTGQAERFAGDPIQSDPLHARRIEILGLTSQRGRTRRAYETASIAATSSSS